MTVHIFGVRHHGPGSARSLKAALTALAPDCILVEGPPDADGLIPMVAHPDLQPPVSILVYNEQHLRASGYFPFTAFSPEWNALRYAVLNGIPARFMDLPYRYRMGLALAAGETKPPVPPPPPDPANPPPEPDIQQDPLYWLAKVAGYTDSERWWDQLIEHRRGDAGVFEAILEAMTALREQIEGPLDPLTALREAYMRKVIRAAIRDGFKRIAVVCGAWHAPALNQRPPARHDQAVLRALKHIPAVPVQTSWVPWTHGRLIRAAGYGAGIQSPGWYHYLWTAGEEVSAGWVTRVAKLLRKYDLDASPAQIIDAVRLADTLAALRERSIPGLQELNEAVLAALCLGQEAPLRLIYKELIVGEMMGKVPLETGCVPLQRDLQRQAADLGLKIDPDPCELSLDLRDERAAARSLLLHRLGLLNIAWGVLSSSTSLLTQPVPTNGGSLLRRIQGANGNAKPGGTFREQWKLAWQPEFAVALIEASSWGATVEDAATAFAHHLADSAKDLPALVRLLDRALLADLPTAVNAALDQLQGRAVNTHNISQLAESIPTLARIARYGTARAVNLGAVEWVIKHMLNHLCLLFPRLVQSLSEQAAQPMFNYLYRVDNALGTLRNAEYNAMWATMLDELLTLPNTHPLIAGRACRIVFESGRMSREDALRALARALSRGGDPMLAALWLDGFLRGSGLALIHDSGLWGLVDSWLRTPPEEGFMEALPTLRRAFSGFSTAERRQIGERARRGAAADTRQPDRIDPARVAHTLPVIALLLGLSSEPTERTA